MQQPRNIALFFVLALVVWFGGLWLQQRLGLLPQRQPQPQADQAEPAKPGPAVVWDKLPPAARAGVLATRLSGMSGLGAGLPASTLAAQVQWPAAPSKPPAAVVWGKLSTTERAGVVAARLSALW